MFRAIPSGGGSGATAITSPGGGAPAGWHPTVISMLLLVAAEIIIAGFLSRHLLTR